METGAHLHETSSASGADDVLVTRLAARDEGALRALYTRHAALVFTVAARIVGAAAAEEVVQDVFLTVWEKHQTFDPERGSFKAWITQIARRRALNVLRHDRARPTGSDDALDEIADEAVIPDEAQWAAHRQMALHRAIDALPAPQKRALSLAFFDELTHEQVASVLRTPVGTAKTRIRLAMKRLAPVLVTLLALVVAVLGWRREERSKDLQQRALRLVTSSDVVPVRLEPSSDVPAAAHGTYRAKGGLALAVLTTSNLPPVGAGMQYVAWVKEGERWIALGEVEVGADGRSLMASEDPALAAPAAEVRVTRESSRGVVPAGPVVIAWRSAP